MVDRKGSCNNLNEEFTRVRTSHKNMPADDNRGIYFRVRGE